MCCFVVGRLGNTLERKAMTEREKILYAAIEAIRAIKADITIDRVLECAGVMDLGSVTLRVRSWNDVREVIALIEYEMRKQ